MKYTIDFPCKVPSIVHLVHIVYIECSKIVAMVMMVIIFFCTEPKFCLYAVPNFYSPASGSIGDKIC